MKKIITAVIAVAVMLSAAACGKTTDGMTNNWNYKTGLATYTRAGSAYGSGTQEQITSTMVAAVFDSQGKIVKINIDEVEYRPGATGEITSKKELGDDYGMKAASGIGKEWYQQVNDLEKWLEGKDISRLTSTATGRMGEYMRSDSQPSGAADEWTARNPDGTTGGTMPDSAMANSGRNSGAGNSGTGNSGANSGMDNSGGMMNDMMDGVNSAINDMTDGGENYTGTTSGLWAGEDLRAVATIDTAGIRTAIEKAWRNAK